MKKQYETGLRKVEDFRFDWAGKKHKPEAIGKMKKSQKGRAIGEKNGSFGSKWIYNDKLKKSKRCKKDELNELLKIDGWKLGRKMKF